MAITMTTVEIDALDGVVETMGEWQSDAAPLQLHPGDVGWYRRFGAAETATALRTWRRDGLLLAVGLLDGATVLRLAFAPGSERDEELAREVAKDASLPERGVLPAGAAEVETPRGALVHDVLGEHGWQVAEPWAPLRRDLAEPVPDVGVRVEIVGADRVSERTAVQRASFGGSSFTDARWHAMAAGPAYADARCLVAYDDQGAPVAGVTVWSAGPGRPGLVEPMGVRPDHRGRGYGTAISVAGAAALRELGSSSALVCTPSSNVAAVATYVAAGFQPEPERNDRRRTTDLR